MSNRFIELGLSARRHQAEDWDWRYDGLEDWPTEKIVAQLRELNIDTDAERFAQQAAAAGRFDALADDWIGQMPKEKRKAGFWEDFPQLGIPVLWVRLAPQVICADLIDARLYRVISAEEDGIPLPDVDGLPAAIAAALELIRFLQGVEPSRRAARFNEVDEGRYYDYVEWLIDLIHTRGARFPDAAIQIADVMSDICRRAEFQSALASVLALGGRGEEALVRTRANIGQFPNDFDVRISAGDVFEELGDEAGAICHWTDALAMARNSDDWQTAVECLEEAFARAGRQAELDEILRLHPQPPGDPTPSDVPDSSQTMPHDDASDSVFASDHAPAARLTRARTIGRNDPCPCGSGKKYKKCCMP